MSKHTMADLLYEMALHKFSRIEITDRHLSFSIITAQGEPPATFSVESIDTAINILRALRGSK